MKVEQRHRDAANAYNRWNAEMQRHYGPEAFARFEASLSDGWRDIASAPRDGTRFLGWEEVPTFDEDAGKTVIVSGPVIAYWFFGDFIEFPYQNRIVQGLRITHWRPLPAPPASKGEG